MIYGNKSFSYSFEKLLIKCPFIIIIAIGSSLGLMICLGLGVVDLNARLKFHNMKWALNKIRRWFVTP